MDRQELYEEWQNNKHRPIYVREHRDVIHEHTDIDEPIPDGSAAEVRDWLDSYKGTVTRQLGESDTTEAAEGEA